jgi:hypothetical protein
MRKACVKNCVKNCVKKQTVENQALERFLYAFTHITKKVSPLTPPTHPWHDFCRQDPQQFYIFVYMRNMRNKMRKILENQRFEALRMLYACFTQT